MHCQQRLTISTHKLKIFKKTRIPQILISIEPFKNLPTDFSETLIVVQLQWTSAFPRIYSELRANFPLQQLWYYSSNNNTRNKSISSVSSKRLIHRTQNKLQQISKCVITVMYTFSITWLNMRCNSHSFNITWLCMHYNMVIYIHYNVTH